MRNWNNFCGMLTVLLMLSVACKAQQTDSVKVKQLHPEIAHLGIFNKYSLLQSPPAVSSKKNSINLGNPFAHWGFMCIGDYKLEQKTGIPLRVRLGSLGYVNKLEGKQ